MADPTPLAVPGPAHQDRPARRVLVMGVASVWGGRLAARLERDPAVETIVGIDTGDPRHELQRTEFVRTESDPGLIARIVRAAELDTLIDTTVLRDTPSNRSRRVDGPAMRDLLAAAESAGVRKFVVKSSAEYYGSARDAPAFFSEDMPAGQEPRSRAGRDLLEVEQAVADFAGDHPDVIVSVLRCALPVGAALRTPHLSLLGLPAVPAILGFDPRWQFVHEDDVVGALAHAAALDMPGVYNVAADGVLALSEVAGLLGKPLLPVLPPWGTLFAGARLRRLGLPVPLGLLRELRYGRGLENRRLKATGYTLRYTSREAILKLLSQQRLRPLLERGQDPYRFESEVEAFLRRSPSARLSGEPASRLGSPGAGGYSALQETELLAVIPSLETEAMQRLREHEAAGPARPAVLEEIDHQLELRGSFGPG